MSAIACNFTNSALRKFEEDLSSLRFNGVPVGPTLASLACIALYYGRGDWRRRTRWFNRLRMVKHFLAPVSGPGLDASRLDGRVVLTFGAENFRVLDLMLPVVKALGSKRCFIFYTRHEVARHIPAGFESAPVEDIRLDAGQWRNDFRKFWPQWSQAMHREICEMNLPPACFDAFSNHVLVNTQTISKFLSMLRQAKPAAILTDYDRNAAWSTLIMAARAMKIKTYTLVHGVMNEGAIGFSPVLADRIFCWGRMDAQKLLAQGEPSEKILIAGCPRLSRELKADPAQSRQKVGLPPHKPVVMLATAPFRPDQCMKFAEAFCKTFGDADDVSAVVRLHPSETLVSYNAIQARYPKVLFLANNAWTLDESLAAADVVVVHNSGVGSDAVLCRRHVIVLDVLDVPLGHGLELIQQAGCPVARDSQELADHVRRLLKTNEPSATAEAYVERFCAAFGDESARKIVEYIDGE